MSVMTPEQARAARKEYADKKRHQLADIEDSLARLEEGPEWDKRRVHLEAQAELIRHWLLETGN